MAINLLGKVVIPTVSLCVVAAMTVVIVLVVQDAYASDSNGNFPESNSTDTETYPTPDNPDPLENLSALYEVGVGTADMTGPCVEIAFVSNL